MTKCFDRRTSLLAVFVAAMSIVCAACAPLQERTLSMPVAPSPATTTAAAPAAATATAATNAAVTVPVALQRYRDDWFDAARHGRWDILQPMIAAGFPIDAQDRSGYTAAILAAYDDQPHTLQQLMAAGANVCIGDLHGNTALMGALFKGNRDVIGLLLNAGCDIDTENYAGETAFVFAVLFGRMQWFDPLLEHGANPAHRDRRGQSVTDIAAAQQNRSVIAALSKALSKRGLSGSAIMGG